jgi:hypothetical protein
MTDLSQAASRWSDMNAASMLYEFAVGGVGCLGGVAEA